jgi:hypothetical protein
VQLALQPAVEVALLDTAAAAAAAAAAEGYVNFTVWFMSINLSSVNRCSSYTASKLTAAVAAHGQQLQLVRSAGCWTIIKQGGPMLFICLSLHTS